MDKRTIVGIVVIVLIILAMPFYQKWVAGTIKKPLEESDTTSVKTPELTSAQDSIKPVQTISEQETATVLQDSAAPAQSKIPLKEIVVISDKFTVRLSTLGGDVRSIKLKGIASRDSGGIELAPNLLGGPNCEFVATIDGKLVSTAGVRFTADRDTIELSENRTTDAVTMVGVAPDGTMFQRRYEFEYGSYHFFQKMFIVSADSTKIIQDATLWWKSGLVPTEKDYKGDISDFAATYHYGEEISHQKASKKHPTVAHDGSTDWIGTRSKYFAVAMMPDKPNSAGGLRINSIWYRTDSSSAEIPIVQVALYHRVGESRFMNSYMFYAGPRDHFILKNYGRNLKRLVDLGWFWLAPITQFLLWFFELLYKIIPNYGWVIILFTLLMKVILTPFSSSQLKSMRRIKELQPQIRSIQERFRDEPQKMNAEVMRIYKKEKVNPIAGCLPLLAQMPIFFALYRALAGGFQFRAQPFVFWIKDLSQRDPYFVLPILMAATMFIQQKISVTDPSQKMMTYMMPVIFLFFFYNMPAGLVLYWTVFNILSFAHMLWLEKKWSQEKEGNMLTITT